MNVDLRKLYEGGESIKAILICPGPEDGDVVWLPTHLTEDGCYRFIQTGRR